MRRDWKIIRQILLELEAAPTATTALRASEVQGFAEQEVAYNMRLLREAGYINATISDSMSGDGGIAVALARSMTNSGHELLDTIRSDTVWEKIQDKFKTSGVEMTFDLVLATGKKIIEAMLS
jgi:predicted transcriptional regulator